MRSPIQTYSADRQARLNLRTMYAIAGEHPGASTSSDRASLQLVDGKLASAPGCNPSFDLVSGPARWRTGP